MEEPKFDDGEDGFAEDDLFSADDDIEPVTKEEASAVASDLSRSYLESDNFEHELAADNAVPGEDFSEIARHDIVEVIADGDRVGRPIVVVYAFRLPSNKQFDHDKLLRYMLSTLDKVVDLDYTIVYCHYGLRSHNKPPLKWLVQAYRHFDRRYKKNLKALYIVHPTRFIKIVWSLFRPFVSDKFEQKVHYVNALRELDADVRVDQLRLAAPVLQHDEQMVRSSIASTSTRPGSPPAPPRPTQQFGVPLAFILSHHSDVDVPPIVTELCAFLEKHGLEVEGIFRKSASVATIRRLEERINRGEHIDFERDPEWEGDRQTAAIHASVLLKSFLRSLGEPVTTNALYPQLIGLAEIPKADRPAAIRVLVNELPRENYVLLRTVVKFLTKVAAKHRENLMTASNLSVVFGPNLTWPTNTNDKVPLAHMHTLNQFCHLLIVHYDEIFG